MATGAERMRRLRERRAVALLPIDGQAPLPVAERLAPAVQETLAALKLTERDEAAARLALRYAQTIDEARDPAYAMRHLGPLLLKSLEALGATPMARRGVREPARPQRPNRIAQLRAAHAEHPAVRKRPGA
jgi:hypothetical protein